MSADAVYWWNYYIKAQLPAMTIQTEDMWQFVSSYNETTCKH